MDYTIHDMLLELSEHTPVSDAKFAKAKASSITQKNNASFARLVTLWVNGVYDEDIECLVDECMWLIK